MVIWAEQSSPGVGLVSSGRACVHVAPTGAPGGCLSSCGKLTLPKGMITLKRIKDQLKSQQTLKEDY